MADKHDPDKVAHIAAALLSGKHDAEPHHIKAAVAAAHGILDEAAIELPEPEPEPEEEGEGDEGDEAE